MIGVGVDGSGAIVASRPLEAQPWFPYATWFGQIMPLFFDRSRSQLMVLAAIAWATLFPLTTWGPDSVDMLTNLNPPTLPLMMLAISQACILRLVKPALGAIMERGAPRAVVFVAGTRLMTIYLWHLPVIIALAGVSLLIPGAAVPPGSTAWWLTRPLFYVATLLVVLALSTVVGRFEAPVKGARVPVLTTAVTAAVLVFVPSFLVTVCFLSLPTATLGAVSIGAAVLILRPRRMHSAKSRRPAAV